MALPRSGLCPKMARSDPGGEDVPAPAIVGEMRLRWAHSKGRNVQNSGEIGKQLEDAVGEFVRSYMSVRPESILVDRHDTHLLITLCQVVSPSEREYAREVDSRTLLERLFAETFDVVKTELEIVVTEITGRAVLHSRISVDPAAGDAVLVLSLGKTEP